MAEDYSRWKIEDLVEEIQREEEALASLRLDREIFDKNIKSIEASIEEEELERYPERVERRARRIRETEDHISRIEAEVKRREESIRRRAEIIAKLEATIPRPTRRIAGYRAAQTREEFDLSVLTGILGTLRARLGRLRRNQIIEEALIERLRDLERDLKNLRATLSKLDEEIDSEEARLERKKAALPKLYRIKIRLYNEITGPKGSPVGMFQGWFDIDAILDPTTEMVKWEWWLTALEIRIAKTHMVGYFKGMAKWISPEDIGQAYQTSLDGIAYGDKTATYARTKLGVPLTKGIPGEFIRKAEQMKVADLIVGESSVEPKANMKPVAENMGVFFQQAMIIALDGTVKWQERRNRWVWHPTDDQVKKVKEELGIE